jgi:hypothetical protein
MIVAPFKVVLDANVLFPFTLRDTLLRAAFKGEHRELRWCSADELGSLHWADADVPVVAAVQERLSKEARKS